jgi:hypothetical protein
MNIDKHNTLQFVDLANKITSNLETYDKNYKYEIEFYPNTGRELLRYLNSPIFGLSELKGLYTAIVHEHKSGLIGRFQLMVEINGFVLHRKNPKETEKMDWN